MPSAVLGFTPNLDKYLKSIKGQPVDQSVDSLVSLLKRHQVSGAEECAVATAHCLLQLITRSKWHDVATLISQVTRVGGRLSRARPDELVVANIVRRVLGLIRDEAAEDRSEELCGAAVGRENAAAAAADDDNGSSGNTPTTADDHARQMRALRSEIIDGIEEIFDEISQVDDQVGASAEVHIRPGDYVVLHQPSTTVQRFVLRAAARRKFSVMIDTPVPTRQAGGGDPRGGSTGTGTTTDRYASFRRKLAASGITLINIAGAGAMCYMPRVDKVILGASAITATGGIVTDSGASVLARAAKVCGATVLVLAGIYKLSPIDPSTEDDVIEWANPSTYVDFADADLVHGVTVRAAVKELVSHTSIDSYITNLGTHSREHLSGLIADHYKPQDTNIHLSAAS
ncbi:translation initiation factor eIF-2B subunit beta [Geosmithia morbida]|uniref:Translation initiation factor eIF2B subunit beta n=1 Tax=Geosmithia morbida TaxID=1094350 RepID=A0A9P4YNS9_9HYPO|nr:translation initiation factor eIF-2B subunit beta [Geosmithia morbida]KAF4119970.1 translation initiation factor eIF-2B subunit beta [Geosmithia morbida]